MSESVNFFVTKFQELLDKAPESPMSAYYRSRPYRNAVVKFRKCSLSDFDERVRIANSVGYNPFLFPSTKIAGCDLMTDSGTTSMTIEQWASMFLGDVAYGSNEGYFELKDQIVDTFGPSWKEKNSLDSNVFIFHQGRAAEHTFFSVLSRYFMQKMGIDNLKKPLKLPSELKERAEKLAKGSDGPYCIIPSNSHFDTTFENISFNKMIPLNLPCQEHLHKDKDFPFRGNIDIDTLETLLSNEGSRVPLVYITITNNTGGGQPVSLENIKEAHQVTHKYRVPLFFDACRFAENAWFIKNRDTNYKNVSIRDIVREMFKYVDGFTVSFKKDGLVNTGGGLVIKDDSLMTEMYPHIKELLTDFQIMVEGHPTYGGLTGRDLKALVEGLRTVTREEYLTYRIRQVERFGSKLDNYNIPFIQPTGGHAVYIDVDKFFEGTETKDEDLKSEAISSLLLIAGHRVVELGIYAFGRCVNGKEYPPDPRVNTVRLAIPRLVYEDNDLLAVAEALKILYQNRDRIPGMEVTYGRELSLRHFKSRFRFKN